MIRQLIVPHPEPLSRAEEAVNCATHAFGFALSVIGGAILLHRTAQRGDRAEMLGVTIYSASLMALYAASALSHSFGHPRVRHFFRSIDQICIFFLIAGTFTPLALYFPRTFWWWVLFLAVWGLTLIGIFCKLFVTRLHNVTVTAYLLVGWLPVVAIKPIVETMPTAALLWIVAGGLLYTVGVWFLVRDLKVRHFHAVWHLLVVAASACHYFAVLLLVSPPAH